MPRCTLMMQRGALHLLETVFGVMKSVIYLQRIATLHLRISCEVVPYVALRYLDNRSCACVPYEQISGICEKSP